MTEPRGGRFAGAGPEPGWRPERLPPLPGDEWQAGEEPGPPAAQPGPAVPQDPAEAVPPRLVRLAFAPLHKRAFGVAIGTAFAFVVAALTAFHVVADPPSGLNLWLLAQYFTGYTVSWEGVLVGAAWAFGVGFVGGWFFAFSRNLALAVSIFIRRTRVELEQTRDFLDHI